MQAKGFALYAVALAGGVSADLVACSIGQVPVFWLQLIPSLYYIGTVYVAITFGVKRGLLAAVVAGICHIVVVYAGCRRTIDEQGELGVLILISLAAGWLTHTRASAPRIINTKYNSSSAAGVRWAIKPYSLDQLAPGFANQLVTPLASIQGAAFVLEDDKLPGEKRQEFVAIIQKECRRLDTILRSSDLVRSQSPEHQKVDVSVLLGRVKKMLPVRHNTPITIHENTGGQCHIFCNEEEITLALVKLTNSVLLAMRDAGEIVISAHSENGRMIIGIEEQHGALEPERLMSVVRTAQSGRAEQLVPEFGTALRSITNQGGEVHLEHRDVGARIDVILPTSATQS